MLSKIWSTSTIIEDYFCSFTLLTSENAVKILYICLHRIFTCNPICLKLFYCQGIKANQLTCFVYGKEHDHNSNVLELKQFCFCGFIWSVIGNKYINIYKTFFYSFILTDDLETSIFTDYNYYYELLSTTTTAPVTVLKDITCNADGYWNGFPDSELYFGECQGDFFTLLISFLKTSCMHLRSSKFLFVTKITPLK
jgi:hypothetical protein